MKGSARKKRTRDAGGNEGYELIRRPVTLRNQHFSRYGTLIRLNECSPVKLLNNYLRKPTGPADPDGQCVQLIRCFNVLIEGGQMHAGSDEHCDEEPQDGVEDLCSVFADEQIIDPATGEPINYKIVQVTIRDVLFVGRGKSGSCTSICLDGPWCPPTLIERCAIVGARCGITVGGGARHQIRDVKFEKCETEIYVERFYKGGPWGNSIIQHPASRVLVTGDPGKGTKIG